MKRRFLLFSLFFFIRVDSFADTPKSVYQLDPVTDGLILGTSAAVNLVPTIFASQIITPRCPCDPQEVWSFDRGVIGNADSTADAISHVTVGLAMAGPVIANAFDVGTGNVFWEDSIVFAEALLVTGGLTTIAKYTFQRPLPVVYSGDDPDLIHSPGGYRSFFSGHTAIAFAALSAASMTLTMRYDVGIWPWIATAVIGSSVAVERVLAGRHFYSDVIVGAAVGTLVGVGIPLLRRRTDASISLVPQAQGSLIAFRFAL